MSTEVDELTASVPLAAASRGSCWFAAVAAGLRAEGGAADLSAGARRPAAGGTAAACCGPAPGTGSFVYGAGGNATGSGVFAFAAGFEASVTFTLCKDSARPGLTRTLSKPPETSPSTTRAPAIHTHGVLAPRVPG